MITGTDNGPICPHCEGTVYRYVVTNTWADDARDIVVHWLEARCVGCRYEHPRISLGALSDNVAQVLDGLFLRRVHEYTIDAERQYAQHVDRSKPKTAPVSIEQEIKRHARANGSELTDQDVGRQLGEDFGVVFLTDVGKRVWLRSYGLTMENNRQRDERKGLTR